MKELLSILKNPISIKLPIICDEYSLPLECFKNVDKKIENQGGQKVYGWRIHNVFNLWYEAERHTVWRSKSGQLIDVTPYFHLSESEFVEDLSGWVYNGMREDNIRFSPYSTSLIKDLFFVKESLTKISELINDVSDKEADYVNIIRGIIDLLEKHILIVAKDKNICYCKSGIQYDDCHQDYILDNVNAILEHFKDIYSLK